MATSDRQHLVERWLHLTRHALPAMAATQRWPIRLDHCFMRVLLDTAANDRWDKHHRRPAIHHMDLDTLRQALAIGEHLLTHPAELPALNRQSLAWRKG